MKNIVYILGITLLMFASAGTAYAKNPHKDPPPTPSPKIWGVYTGNTDQTMSAFESLVGSKMSVDAMFWGWDSPFPQTIAGTQGKTLLIFWEPSFGFNQINNGSKDAYIAQFAQGAKAYGFPVILAPFDEFNLNEAPWGNTVASNTPQTFITAWQRVHNIFVQNNASNVKFALAYNNTSIPAAPYSSFYPGSGYVDYVGVDGFNFGGQTFSQVFSSALTEAKTFGKPVWILSTGSVSPQSQFLTDLGASGLPWIWFNQSPFTIDSTSLSAFKSIIQ